MKNICESHEWRADFQKAISGAFFVENVPYHIPLEPGRAEFSDFRVSLCTGVSWFTLQGLFWFQGLHCEMWNFNVAIEIATKYRDFPSSINVSSKFQSDLIVLIEVGEVMFFLANCISQQIRHDMLKSDLLWTSVQVYDDFLISFHQIFAYFKRNYHRYFVHHWWF